MLLEERLPGGRDVVDLLSLALLDAHVAHVLEELERGIDGARRRRVPAAHPLLERLHDLVAVPGLLLQQAQDDVLHLARLEHLMAAPAMAAAGTFGTAPCPGTRTETRREELMKRPILMSVPVPHEVTSERRYIVRYSGFRPCASTRLQATSPGVWPEPRC